MLETGNILGYRKALFTQLGSDNTFEAAPAVLGTKKGYTTAVFPWKCGEFLESRPCV